jgi:hypothetical protein
VDQSSTLVPKGGISPYRVVAMSTVRMFHPSPRGNYPRECRHVDYICIVIIITPSHPRESHFSTPQSIASHSEHLIRIVVSTLRSAMRGSVHCHRNWVTRLHENGAWSSEFAHKAFTSCQVADNPARRNTLERVFAIPSHKMSVVDDVFLAFAELVVMKRSVLCLRVLA